MANIFKTRSGKNYGLSGETNKASPFSAVSKKVFTAGSIPNMKLERRKNDSKYQCVTCHKYFSSRKTLWKHKQIAKFHCKHCGNSFCGEKSFTRHVSHVHSETQKRFVCDESGCGFSTNIRRDLTRHNVTHTGERPHLCPICNTAFGRAGNMKIHMLICKVRNGIAEASLSSSSSSLPQLPEPTVELNQTENRVVIRTEPSIDETIETPDHIDCNVSVLWCLQISNKLQAHREQQHKLFTKSDIGKMLSDAVVGENPDMDWNKPFLLLDVALDLGDQSVVENNMFIRIPVVEKSTATPSTSRGKRVPTKRLWQLELSHCLIQVGKEILRCPDISKTIMIWGAERYLYEKPLDNSPFMGVIRVDDSAVANLLIVREIRDYEANDTIQIDLEHWNHRIERKYVEEVAAVHLSNIEAHDM